MNTPITKIAIYAKDMPKTSKFYQKRFGFQEIANEDGKLIELAQSGKGCKLMILQASKGHRVGQSSIKIVFDVEDIETFKEQCLANGLKFGAIHQCDGYAYANARDPGKNPIQISSRAFR